MSNSEKYVKEEEEEEAHRSPSGYHGSGGAREDPTSNLKKAGKAELEPRSSSSSVRYIYLECKKNKAVGKGEYQTDGCREFMAAGGEVYEDEDNDNALTCDACGCHKNFHRKEVAKDGPIRAGNITYGECWRNLAAHMGEYTHDGCKEFIMKVGEGEGDQDSIVLSCGACGCHRNYHQKKEVVEDDRASKSKVRRRYEECCKNLAAKRGKYWCPDGCQEFLPSPTAGLTCHACGCHRNFHRIKEVNEEMPLPPQSQRYSACGSDDDY